MGKYETLIYEELWGKKYLYNIMMKTGDGKNEGFLVTVNIIRALCQQTKKKKKHTTSRTIKTDEVGSVGNVSDFFSRAPGLNLGRDTYHPKSYS
jgi:hypothetical protein